MGYVSLAFMVLCALGIFVGSMEDAVEHDIENVTPSETDDIPEISVSEIKETVVLTEISDAERLGVTDVELRWLEHSMLNAGWDYDRTDFERVYRLKENEMLLNPAVFVQYEVTIKDGTTHKVTLNRSLLEE